MSPEWTDGNALAGPLGEVFAVDVTTAIGTCVGCGRTGLVAEVHVYAQAPGVVARCPSCDTVLIRMVRTPDRVHLDLRGLTSLTFPL